MTPTQVDLIDCIVGSLDQHIGPELKGSMARSQLLTVRYLLHQLRLRVLHETDALSESVTDLRETLGAVRDQLSDVNAGAYPLLGQLAGDIDGRLNDDSRTAPPGLGPLAWEPRFARLRAGVDDALRVFGGTSSDPDVLAAVERSRQIIHACIARQLEREARWMVSDYAEQRR